MYVTVSRKISLRIEKKFVEFEKAKWWKVYFDINLLPRLTLIYVRKNQPLPLLSRKSKRTSSKYLSKNKPNYICVNLGLTAVLYPASARVSEVYSGNGDVLPSVPLDYLVPPANDKSFDRGWLDEANAELSLDTFLERNSEGKLDTAEDQTLKRVSMLLCDF